jgi:hypothetical protein
MEEVWCDDLRSRTGRRSAPFLDRVVAAMPGGEES